MGMIGYYLALPPEEADRIDFSATDIYSLASDKEDTLDIDKSWHLIYFIFMKMAVNNNALSFVVPMSDDTVVIECANVIPTFRISPSQVKKTAEALSIITVNVLKENYNFSEIVENDVYPIMGDNDNADEIFEYICVHFAGIKEFFAKAAQKSETVFFYLA